MPSSATNLVLKDLKSGAVPPDAQLVDNLEILARSPAFPTAVIKLTLAKIRQYLGAVGSLIPSGGTTGQVLSKNSNADGDFIWSTVTGGTTSAVTFDNTGTGAASGASFNGTAAIEVSYNTVGAQKASGLLTAYAGATWTGGNQVPVLTAANTISLMTIGAAAGDLLDKASGDSLYQPKGTYLTANQSISLTGDATGTGTTSIAVTIANAAVSLAKMANLPANTIIGNNTGAAATPIALTAAQLAAMLPVATTTNKGLVPAPGTSNGYFLKDDLTWAAPTGGGGGGGGSGSAGGGLLGLTRLKLSANQAAAWAWDNVSWDTMIEDNLGAYSSANPTYVTVPANVTKVRVSAFLAIQGAGNPHYVYVQNVTQGTILVEATRSTGSGVVGMMDIVSGWETVTPGDVLRVYYNPGGNGATILGGAPDVNTADFATTFGKPSRVEFEWANAATFSGASGAGVAYDFARAYLNTAGNTASGAWTKCVLDTVDYDTNSIWDATNKRFQPKKAGYYQINGRVRTNSSGGNTLSIAKNGSPAHGFSTDGTGDYGVSGSTLIYCNGTTDYLELYYFANGVRALTTGTFDTFLEISGPINSGGNNNKRLIPFFFTTAPAASEIMAIYACADIFTIPANLAGTQVKKQSSGANPAADLVFTVYQNSTSIGTITIHSDGTVSLTGTGCTTAVGDVISVVAPATPQPAAQDWAINLVGGL